MREHILVFRFDENLIRRLHNKRVVVIAEHFDQVHPICQLANDNHNSLHCIVIKHSGSLASIPFHESWRGIPIAVYASEMGAFKEIINRLPLLRDMSMRIFLTADNKDNFTSLQILASLGLDCGVSFDDKEIIDWEKMNDLMTYSVYSKVGHASVEPFQLLAHSYDPTRLTDFSGVYFNNPHTYLHIDNDENIAATETDFKAGKFLAKGLDTLPQIFESEKFEEAIHAWQEHFLKPEGCAYCPAWRVCIGKFSETFEKNPGCQKFFVDMMEAADHVHALQNKSKRKELWQP